jgi:hypothetical protein
MKNVVCRFIAVLLSLSFIPGWAMGQSAMTLVVGMVGTAQGKPVPGVRIAARDISGKVVGEAATDVRGRYALPNLPIGRYLLTLDPLKSPYKGQTVASAVGPEGLTVDWFVAEASPALAAATIGAAGAGAGAAGTGLAPETTGALIFLGLGTVMGAGAGVIANNSGVKDGGAPATVTSPTL